jgi:hypothetical protein
MSSCAVLLLKSAHVQCCAAAAAAPAAPACPICALQVIELPLKHPELFESLGIAQPKVRRDSAKGRQQWLRQRQQSTGMCSALKGQLQLQQQRGASQHCSGGQRQQQQS